MPEPPIIQSLSDATFDAAVADGLTAVDSPAPCGLRPAIYDSPDGSASIVKGVAAR